MTKKRAAEEKKATCELTFEEARYIANMIHRSLILPEEGGWNAVSFVGASVKEKINRVMSETGAERPA